MNKGLDKFFGHDIGLLEQRKCTPNEFSKILCLNKITLDNSECEVSKVRAIDFLKNVMKKSKAVWQ